jgi:hypothetical protein
MIQSRLGQLRLFPNTRPKWFNSLVTFHKKAEDPEAGYLSIILVHAGKL